MAANARPKLVKGIVAAEPVSPPIEEAERGRSGRGRLWGLTNLPVHYDPPIKGGSYNCSAKANAGRTPASKLFSRNHSTVPVRGRRLLDQARLPLLSSSSFPLGSLELRSSRKTVV